MAVKRRTVWLSDEEWADLDRRAKKDGITISRAIVKGFEDLDEWVIENTVYPRPEPRMVELTPAVEQQLHARERAFHEFRPVPKPGQRKEK